MPEIHHHQFPSGLHLLAEPMSGVGSASMTLLTPAGVAAQDKDQQGVAPLLSEMIGRGAGGLSSREHSEALDRLGVHRSTHAGGRHLRIGATMIASKLDDALPLLLDQGLRPNFDASELEPSRDLCLQEIDALDDEPQDRVMIDLRRRHMPEPLGRQTIGLREHLEQLTLDDLRAFWKKHATPGGAILGIAGDIDWPSLVKQIGELTADWSGKAPPIEIAEPRQRGYGHLDADTAQVHIALAFDSVPDPDERSMLQRLATAVLSGGSSSRLFTEVREKRGLCYSVYATYAGAREHGNVMAYAGTTTPRAQETLDVMLHELRRLSEGIDAEELERARIGMKSRLIMQGESTNARSSAIAADQYVHGRPRTLDELAQKVDAVTIDALNDYVRKYPTGELTVATIGPQALDVK